MKKFLTLILCLGCLVIFTSEITYAASKKKKASLILCVKNNKIVAKEKCGKDEKALSKTNSSAGVLNVPTVKGDQGPKGFTGAQGAQGLTGTPGRSSFDPLKSGNGAFGLVGGDYNGDGTGTECSQVNFPVPLQNDNYSVVIVRTLLIELYCPYNEDRNKSCCFNGGGGSDQTQNCFANTKADSRCTGTAQNPTATGGALCIYPSSIKNAFSPNIQGSDRFGFKICWSKDGEELSSKIISAWALSAP